MKSDKQGVEIESEESSFDNFSTINLAASQEYFNKNTGVSNLTSPRKENKNHRNMSKKKEYE